MPSFSLPQISNYIKFIITILTKMKVQFKETYMPHPVIRECTNMTKEEVIKVYNLESPDIEWYKFLDE